MRQPATRMRSFLFPVILAAALLLGACAPAQKAGTDEGADTSAKTPAKLSAPELAKKAVTDLGDEKGAFNAVLSAWDRGYSLKQIVKGIQNEKLAPGGVIDGSAPDGRPQRYLRSAGPEPALLASYALAAVKLAARPNVKPSIDEAIEKQKANWTVWLLGVIEKGYSVEQITEFMLEHDRPVEISENDIGPVISTARVSDNRGRPPLGMDGKPIQRVVKPAFPPKGTAFDTIDVNGAEQFTADLARDFDDLISGKGTLKPARGGRPAKGKFKPRAFRFKLKLMPGNKTAIRSSDVILRIDADGRATGSYSVELFERGSVSEVVKAEDGTFQGRAVYPKTKGQMISLDLDGSRHIKTTSTMFSDGRTTVNESSISIKKMFQGVIAVDYSKGSGFLYGEGAMYQWRID